MKKLILLLTIALTGCVTTKQHKHTAKETTPLQILITKSSTSTSKIEASNKKMTGHIQQIKIYTDDATLQAKDIPALLEELKKSL